MWGIIDKVVADKDQAARLAHDIATMADRHVQEEMLAQIAVNKKQRRKSIGFRLRGGHSVATFAY